MKLAVKNFGSSINVNPPFHYIIAVSTELPLFENCVTDKSHKLRETNDRVFSLSVSYDFKLAYAGKAQELYANHHTSILSIKY